MDQSQRRAFYDSWQPRVAGILETVGGALLLIGLFTRCAAFVLCGLMAVAYFMAHASQGSMLVSFVLSGAGGWSVDRVRR